MDMEMSMDLKDGFYQLKNEEKSHFDTQQLLHYLSPKSFPLIHLKLWFQHTLNDSDSLI